MKANYNTYLLVLFLVSISFVGAAQKVTVRDAQTGERIEHATFYSKELNRSAMTNVRGRADISALKGADSIEIRHTAYESELKSYDELKAMGFKVLLLPRLFGLGEVVVSANRWEQDKDEVPIKIVDIDKRDIQLINPQTTADLLDESGQVFVQKSQFAGGSPMIRGFAANRVLIVVDGVRMNNAIYRSGNLQNVISVDPNAISGMEVIFGPASTIYGSDAIGGVMDFHMLDPRLSLSDELLINANAMARYGSAANEMTGHLDFSIGNRKFASLTSVSYTRLGDLQMGSHGPDDYLRRHYAERINGQDSMLVNGNPEKQLPSGFELINLMQKFRYSPNAEWDFKYNAYFSTTSDAPRYDRLIEYKDGLLKSAEWYYGPQQWLMNSIVAEHHKANALYTNARLTAAYQDYTESRHDRKFGKTDLRHQTEQVGLLSINADFDKKLKPSGQLFYGMEMAMNTIGSEAETEDIETGQTQKINSRYPDGATWNSYAAYLTYKHKLNTRWTFTAGSRYTHVLAQADFDTSYFRFPFTEAKLNTGALSGSAGMVYSPGNDWLLAMNLSTGFRVPNIDDMGKVFDSEPGSVIVPNADLNSEYAYQAELNASKIFSDRLKFEASVFYTYLDNALVRRDFNYGGRDSLIYDGEMSRVLAIQNAAHAYVYGVQASAEVLLVYGFSLRSHISWQQGKEEDEDEGSYLPMRHVAPVYGSTHLIYKQGHLKAHLYVNYNGEISHGDLAPSEQSKAHMYAANSEGLPYCPAWYTLNLKTEYRVNDYLMAGAGIGNITDQRYLPYSSGIVAPGRNVFISLRATY